MKVEERGIPRVFDPLLKSQTDLIVDYEEGSRSMSRGESLTVENIEVWTMDTKSAMLRVVGGRGREGWVNLSEDYDEARGGYFSSLFVSLPPPSLRPPPLSRRVPGVVPRGRNARLPPPSLSCRRSMRRWRVADRYDAL